MTGRLDAPPPPGFRPLPITPERAAGFNPIRFHAACVGSALALGFRCGPEHLNHGGRCHGGVLASFCDIQLAFAILFETPDLHTTILPTVSLSLDYLAAVPAGAWVQAVGGTIALTRNLAFAQSIATADGVPVVRANGVYKAGGARVTGIDLGDWLRAEVDRA